MVVLVVITAERTPPAHGDQLPGRRHVRLWARGFWPKKARVAGENTGYRTVPEDGECSTPVAPVDNLWY